MELLGLPAGGGRAPGENEKKSEGLALPQELLWRVLTARGRWRVRGITYRGAVRSHRKAVFFPLECERGGGEGAVENRLVTKRTKMPQVTHSKVPIPAWAWVWVRAAGYKVAGRVLGELA